MDILIETFKNTGTLHHAYLIEGERNTVRPKLFEFIHKDVGHILQGNPDFWHGEYSSFTIDDARDLRDRQSNKSFSESRKIFVIETDLITIEAQNALLKMLEEPTPQTHFFIIMPTRELLVPTVRSRLMIMRNQTDTAYDKTTVAFLNSSPAERLKTVGEIIEAKDRGRAIKLVDSLISLLHEKSQSDPKPTYVKILSNLLQYRSYLNDRSPSLKLILEHIALVL